MFTDMMNTDPTFKNVANVPSIFATQRNPATTTEKFHFISTANVITALADYGFHPVSATQTKTRLLHKEGYQKHVVKFENRNIEIEKAVGKIAKLSMLLKHSHDGSHSLTMLSSIDILRCLNGAMYHAGDLGELRIMHRSFTEEALIERIEEFGRRMPLIVAEIQQFQSVQLGVADQHRFVKKAIELRFDPLKDQWGVPTNNYPVTIHDVLKPRHGEDTRNLWDLFNVAQENLIDKGGIARKTEKGRNVKTRAIRAIDTNITMNRGIWELTRNTAHEQLGITQ